MWCSPDRPKAAQPTSGGAANAGPPTSPAYLGPDQRDERAAAAGRGGGELPGVPDGGVRDGAAVGMRRACHAAPLHRSAGHQAAAQVLGEAAAMDARGGGPTPAPGRHLLAGDRCAGPAQAATRGSRRRRGGSTGARTCVSPAPPPAPLNRPHPSDRSPPPGPPPHRQLGGHLRRARRRPLGRGRPTTPRDPVRPSAPRQGQAGPHRRHIPGLNIPGRDFPGRDFLAGDGGAHAVPAGAGRGRRCPSGD